MVFQEEEKCLIQFSINNIVHVNVKTLPKRLIKKLPLHTFSKCLVGQLRVYIIFKRPGYIGKCSFLFSFISPRLVCYFLHMLVVSTNFTNFLTSV